MKSKYRGPPAYSEPLPVHTERQGPEGKGLILRQRKGKHLGSGCGHASFLWLSHRTLNFNV